MFVQKKSQLVIVYHVLKYMLKLKINTILVFMYANKIHINNNLDQVFIQTTDFLQTNLN